MKVQVLQEDLSKALSICSRFSSTRVQLPVLANILLETSENKLRVVSTNLEVSVSISIGAKITEEGSITIPSRVITDLVGNLKTGQISLNAERESLQILTSEFESTITGMNSGDFPSVAHTIGAESFKFTSEIFASSLSKVLFSVSTDDTRPSLTGVLLILKDEEVVFVGTDGFRLSQKKVTVKGSGDIKKIIIPKNTLSELVRIHAGKDIEMSFKKSENQVIFSTGNIVLASRIIEGEFPDFEKIIPKNTGIKLNLDKDDFIRNIKLASVFAKDAANVIKIHVLKNGIEVTAESQQYGVQKGRVDAKVEGKIEENFVIAFNYRFIEEFLNSLDGENLQLEFSDPNSPALFLDPEDTDLLHIIMPVRMQS